ncbi:MAG: type II toxin-antitoxin system VapC family toxin [Gemmatimonadetes bacterium]|nr:type II toxin-antitoxin system VapC family toxin [Gemmatimonadota bacterium]
MRRYFFDASAAVKLYVVEPGSTTVRDMVRGARATPPRNQVLVCDIVLPETLSALLQIRRSPTAARRGISAAALRLVLPQVWVDLGGEGPMLVRTASETLRAAARIVERHELRAPDALHIAAALDINATHPVLFVSGDVEQCKAARAEGLEVIELVA